MSMFGTGIGFIHDNGIFGIGFSLFVVGIAALNLVLDLTSLKKDLKKMLQNTWSGSAPLP